MTSWAAARPDGGPYAAHPDQAGIEPYEKEAVAALDFLATQRRGRL